MAIFDLISCAEDNSSVPNSRFNHKKKFNMDEFVHSLTTVNEAQKAIDHKKEASKKEASSSLKSYNNPWYLKQLQLNS